VALGGVDDNYNAFNSVQLFSAATQTWTTLPNMTIEREAPTANYVVDKAGRGLLIACGGSGRTSCEMLDLSNKLYCGMEADRKHECK
jgi:hypothetical protein